MNGNGTEIPPKTLTEIVDNLKVEVENLKKDYDRITKQLNFLVMLIK
jgi:uncharacterized protein (DUF433 family)